MVKPGDERLGRLLAGRDEPSIVEREELFRKIDQEVAAPRSRPRFVLAFGGVFVAASVALLALVVFRPLPDELTPRGHELASFSPRCLDADAPGPCRRGGRLVLEVVPPKDRPFFAAFSRRPDGTIIWYAPRLGEKSAMSGERAAVFAIDEEHRPGTYAVYAVFSERALEREELKRKLGDELAGDGTITVVERMLVIEDAQ
jgi:hypothetical protein